MPYYKLSSVYRFVHKLSFTSFSSEVKVARQTRIEFQEATATFIEKALHINNLVKNHTGFSFYTMQQFRSNNFELSQVKFTYYEVKVYSLSLPA